MKKAASIVLSVLGIVLFVCGSNVSTEASFNEERISQAESTAQGRPVLGPVRRGIRNQAYESKQQALSLEGQKVAASQASANWLRGIGAVLFIIGAGCFVLSFRKN
jgi:hypothetical protein